MTQEQEQLDNPGLAAEQDGVEAERGPDDRATEQQQPAPGDDEPAEGADSPAPDRLGADIAELTADLQRLQAEYVNYKRRVDRDRELVLQNAKVAILSSLLPLLDDVDRAREHGELEGGFKAVAESLERIVQGQGLSKFGASGDEFDPRRHEALLHGHSPDVKTSTCETIVQAGYSIGDRVVRPALVTVVDPEPEAVPDAQTPEQPVEAPDLEQEPEPQDE